MTKINTKKVGVDSILVPHAIYQSAYDRIEQQIEADKRYSEPTCLALLGESRSGKSRLIKSLAQNYPEQVTKEGKHVPLLRIETPAKPTVKGLVETMLYTLGDPMWAKRGSEVEKTQRLYEILKRTKTHAIVIDEFQHFYDKASHKVQHHLSDWLKIFVDRTGLCVIVVGLKNAMAVINQNQQLRGRFHAPIQMRRFEWTDKADQRDFRACLNAYQQALSRYDMPDLAHNEMALRFYCATGGLIGYVAKIMQEVCSTADRKSSKAIRLKDFASAFDVVIWDHGMFKLNNPFDSDFGKVNNQGFLDQAHRIGIESTYLESVTSGGRH